jgi:hypothetical protein
MKVSGAMVASTIIGESLFIIIIGLLGLGTCTDDAADSGYVTTTNKDQRILTKGIMSVEDGMDGDGMVFDKAG